METVSNDKPMKVEVDDLMLNALQKTYDAMLFRLHFKPNPKYDPDPHGVFYIGYSDMSDYKYVIRKRKMRMYSEDNDPVVATYDCLRSILEDGWRAD